jgi:hypothetical protein
MRAPWASSPQPPYDARLGKPAQVFGSDAPDAELVLRVTPDL